MLENHDVLTCAHPGNGKTAAYCIPLVQKIPNAKAAAVVGALGAYLVQVLSMFGEPLDAVFCLQERIYPMQRMPIILPFLAGILTLGGKKTGHLCVQVVLMPAALKKRLDQGSYMLEVDDSHHMPASLFSTHWCHRRCPTTAWCYASEASAEACCVAVDRLPTVYRHVVLPYFALAICSSLATP